MSNSIAQDLLLTNYHVGAKTRYDNNKKIYFN